MQTVYKYPLYVGGLQTISMPTGAEVLSAQVQRGQICLWALCNPEAQREDRTFAIYGTGHPVEDTPGKFLGTVQLEGGAFIFHVFEALGPRGR